MNRSQIEEIKASIKTEYETKINKLRSEMEVALSALTTVEDTLFVSNIIQRNVPKSVDMVKAPKMEEINKKSETRIPSVTSRIKSALDKIHGEFTSPYLRELVNNDGIGKKLTKESFAPALSKLKSDGIIVMLTKPQGGNRPGKYIKAEEIKTQTKSSPNTEAKLF